MYSPYLCLKFYILQLFHCCTLHFLILNKVAGGNKQAEELVKGLSDTR